MLKKHIISLLGISVLILSSLMQTTLAYSLPPHAEATLQAVYEKYKTLRTGKNADYIPELAHINPDYFAIVIVTVDGKILAIGDTSIPFAIESISKPFMYALALQDNNESDVM